MTVSKYPAREALQVVDGPLAKELSIHRFDAISRSKAQLFAVGGATGRQFAIVLGNTDVETGFHPAQQTRVILEKCDLPALPGIEPCDSPYEGSRVKNNQDSELSPPGQSSCLVSDEPALRALLRWYAGHAAKPAGSAASSLEQTRIEKAAVDAGFDLTPEMTDGWLVFRSSAHPVKMAIRILTDGYDLGVSLEAVGHRLSADIGLHIASSPDPWEVRLNGISSYIELHRALRRGAEIAQAVSVNPLSEFQSKTKVPPDSTEVQRLVTQRVGQNIFRRELVGYWGGRCAVSGLDVVELLRASHIKPWAKCDSDAERLDVFNGLLLAPHLDALFDGGWVTFFDSGQIQISAALSAQQRARVGISGKEQVIGLAESHMPYLHWHRENWFKNL